jgi:F-type H+-transporting ATPase subunit gamma
MKEWQAKGCEVDVVCVGTKASAFFRRLKVNMLGSVTHLGDVPHLDQLVGVVKAMLDQYESKQLDRVFVCYNRFVNTMTQEARIHQLLPLPPSEAMSTRFDWDYIYEPSPEVVLDHVMKRYVESLVYQALLENVASEHAARMVAMKAASDNATKLIGTMQLIYNKARQAAITQEISEIVGGAAAV